MATSISSVKFSFHRFESVNYVLPAYRAFSDAFQFIVNGLLPVSNNLFMGVCNSLGILIPSAFSVPVQASILAYRMKIPNTISVNPFFFLYSVAVGEREVIYNRQPTYDQFKKILYDDFGYQLEVDNTFISKSFDEIVIRWGLGGSVMENTLQPFWGRGYVRANGDYIYPNVLPGECFTYCIMDVDNSIIGQTGKLKVQTSDRFTSLIEYRNNEDAFQFLYKEDNRNIVRLPLYLSRPQWPEKRSVYVKSNGLHKLLSAFIEEQYELRTEYMPSTLHRYIKILLAHDQVIIDCVHMDETPVEVINSDSYNPKWDAETDTLTAQGNSNIIVSTFGYTNSNCEQNAPDCSPPIMSVGTITETSVQLLFQLPEATTRMQLNYRRIGQPFWEYRLIETAETSFILEDLYAGADYEIKVASNCGLSYGSFGRLKTFTTSGAASCTAPNSLTVGGAYDFTVNLPLPQPDNVELFIMRPDGSTAFVLIPTTGFTINPFAFHFTDPEPQQFGLTRFKLRSVCAPGDVSAYSNEIISNYQTNEIGVSFQYDFSLFAGRSGNILIKRNGAAIINSSVSSSYTTSVLNADQIEVTVSGTSGNAAHLRVYRQADVDNTITVLFDSAASTAPLQTFIYTITLGYLYFITASI